MCVFILDLFSWSMRRNLNYRKSKLKSCGYISKTFLNCMVVIPNTEHRAWGLTFSFYDCTCPESLWSKANYFGVVCIFVLINDRSLQGVDFQQLRTGCLKAYFIYGCYLPQSPQWDKLKSVIMGSTFNRNWYSYLELFLFPEVTFIFLSGKLRKPYFSNLILGWNIIVNREGKLNA